MLTCKMVAALLCGLAMCISMPASAHGDDRKFYSVSAGTGLNGWDTRVSVTVKRPGNRSNASSNRGAETSTAAPASRARSAAEAAAAVERQRRLDAWVTTRLDYCAQGWDIMDSDRICEPLPTTPNTPTTPGQPARVRQPAPPTHQQVQTLVQQLIGTLQIPQPEVHIGPDPSLNKWNKAFVGYPLWLWPGDQDPLTTRVSGGGLTITMDAELQGTVFTMGDGNRITCGYAQPWTEAVEPGTKSPTCGYRYQQPSGKDRTYTITATTHWDVAWTAAGHHGTIPITRTTTRQLPVGELQSIIVR